jgi:hypothetical protein
MAHQWPANQVPAKQIPANEMADRRRMLRYVMFAVLIWGSVIAVGALLFGYDQQTGDVHFSPSLARGAIVEGCVLGFLGLWSWLAFRGR